VVPVANAEYLYKHLPNSTLDVLDAGHYVWEEAADDYARILTHWWQTN
jgi:pimeloyl-ACP methyl ester carboxylesterase